MTVLATIVAAEAKVTYLTQLLERGAGGSAQGSGDGPARAGDGPARAGESKPKQQPQSHA